MSIEASIEWIKRIIQESGGTKRIIAELKEYRQRVELFESRRLQLVEQYPDKWAAMVGRELIIVADSYEGLLAEIDARGIPRRWVVIRFLDSAPLPMILQTLEVDHYVSNTL